MKATTYSLLPVQEFPVDGSLREQIMFCCRYGALAPSVHNLQPWSIEVKDKNLVVSVYKDLRTEDSDATGRQTWISVGCFVENVLQTAEACGMKARIDKEDYAQESISITFGISKGSTVKTQPLKNIVGRMTSRNHFSPVRLSGHQLAKFNEAQKDLAGAQLTIRDDEATIELMAALTKQAVGLALSMPTFKKELAKTFRANSSKHKTGIPGYALGYGALRSKFESFRFSHLPVAPKESTKESERMRASAGLVFVTASGDIAKYWFRAGRLYERAALLLTEFGLSHSTNAATVEAPDFHQEVESHIGTTNRLQAVIRYGKSNKIPSPSPRLSVEELFTSNASRD